MDSVATLRPATPPAGDLPRVDAGVTLTLVGHPDPTRIGEMAAVELGPDRRLALSRREPLFADADGSARALEDPHLSRSPTYLSFETGCAPVLADSATVRPLPDGSGWYVGLAGRIGLIVEPGLRPPAARERHGLVGVSAATEQLRGQIDLAGASTLPALLLGETGTGKELVGQAIHRVSRRGGPLIAVNLAAIPESTAASQLFGHARGAFTDAAAAHDGYFVQAAGGTLFLDEIGEATLPLQVQLLRALEQKEIQPVGGRVRTVDVRLIAATDADLAAAIAAGKFRQALLYRLGGLSIPLLPLRRRPADVAVQLVHFLGLALAELGRSQRLRLGSWRDPPWLDLGVLEHALAARWPGNSRELRSVAGRVALADADKPRISLIDLVAPALNAPRREAAPERLTISTVRDALAAHANSVRGAARALGVAPNTLYQRMHEFGIARAGELGDHEIAAAIADAGDDLGAAARQLGVSLRGLKRRLGRP